MTRPHPVIRVSLLLVFIAGMSTARPAVLLAGTLLLGLAYAGSGFPGLAGLAGMLLRLRWLLLAILVVYGWWTPGEPLLPALAGLSPAREGIGQGLLRAGVLVLIVSAVHLLVRVTGRGALLGSILLLSRPLLTGAMRERLAVRLLLTMESIAGVREVVASAVHAHRQDGRGLAGAGVLVRYVYREVLARAGRAAGQPVEVHDLEMPPPLQWLFPLALLCAFVLALSIPV